MKLPIYNRIAEHIPDAPVHYRCGTISVHGMSTRGAWQKAINTCLSDAGIRHSMVDYGYAVLRVRRPDRAIVPIAEQIVTQFRDNRNRGLYTGAIAHSFGTLSVARALQWNPDLALRRVVLWGCILPRDFDWNPLLERQVEAVLNESCEADIWPKIAKMGAIPRAGDAGCYGFTCSNPSIHERAYNHTEHSRLGTLLHCETTWVPFLLTGTPPA